MTNLLTAEKTNRSRFQVPSPAAEAESPLDRLVPERAAEDLVKLFKLLSDETRLRILFALTKKDEMHVRALCDLLHQSQPAVSHHLALLRDAELIDRRRSGKHNFYRLTPRRFERLLDLVFTGMANGKRRLGTEN